MPVLLQPAQRVRVTQNIRTRDGVWSLPVEGRVVSCEPRPTGSWFAHGKNDRLWLQRLRIEKADGEFIDLILDDGSEVVILRGSSPRDAEALRRPGT
jgi:hypothetical protein